MTQLDIPTPEVADGGRCGYTIRKISRYKPIAAPPRLSIAVASIQRRTRHKRGGAADTTETIARVLILLPIADEDKGSQ